MTPCRRVAMIASVQPGGSTGLRIPADVADPPNNSDGFCRHVATPAHGGVP